MTSARRKGAQIGKSGTADIRRYYDQTRLDYHFVWSSRKHHAFHFGYHDEVSRRHGDTLANANRTLADLARVSVGTRVLDAGWGIGGSSLWLAEERSAAVVGITLVEDQAERARSFSAQRGLGPRASFLRADFTETPFRSESFEVVWALESLCHAGEKSVFYREASRLLTPGGRLVVAEYMRTNRPSLGGGEPMVREWLDGWAIPDLDTPSEHVANAKAAGLESVRVEDFTARTRPSLRRLHRIARLSFPFAVAARLLGIRTETQHANVVASIRQFEALARGLWLYGLLTAVKP
jgi:cyclopropane fatty-acyl-phospholipid synthase-like methyltransferase